MLPAFLRFPLRDYPDFFPQARVIRSSSFRAYILPNDKKNFRFAVVVKKAHAQATGRALTRRRILSLLSELVKTPQRQNGPFCDVVFVVQGKPREASDYKEELEQFWGLSW